MRSKSRMNCCPRHRRASGESWRTHTSPERTRPSSVHRSCDSCVLATLCLPPTLTWWRDCYSAATFGRRAQASRRLLSVPMFRREISRTQRFPDIQDWSNDAPSGFHHVGALEKSGVADHAIVQQSLVAGARRGAEIIGVREIHIHVTETHDRPGHLRAEAERDAFLRLDVKNQHVRRQAFDGSIAEQHKRRTAELDRDLSVALG